MGVIGRASPIQPSKMGRDAQPYGTRAGRAVSTIAHLPARGGSPAARGVSVGHAPALPATFHVASARTPAVAATEDMQDTLPPRRARELRAGRAPWLSWGPSSVHASCLRQVAAHVAARRLISSALGRASRASRGTGGGEKSGGSRARARRRWPPSLLQPPRRPPRSKRRRQRKGLAPGAWTAWSLPVSPVPAGCRWPWQVRYILGKAVLGAVAPKACVVCFCRSYGRLESGVSAPPLESPLHPRPFFL